MIPLSQEVLFLFRIIERIFITIVFVGLVGFLVYLYRCDVRTHKADIKAEKLRLTATVTLPITVMFLFLGYAFISLSHPIEWKDNAYITQNTEKIDDGKVTTTPTVNKAVQFRGFESDNLLRIYTLLLTKLRDEEKINTPEYVNKYQRLLKLSIGVYKLQNGKHGDEIGKALDDEQVGYKKFNDFVDSLASQE